MANFYATTNTDTFNGGDDNDNFVINLQVQLNPTDVFNGGAGTDRIWAGQGMDNYEENFNYTGIAFQNIEELAFNYMKMPMPGTVIFTSDQFGPGLVSNNLVVYGAWDHQDITVNLAAGDSSFDASGWTFPTPSTTTVGGVPAGGSFYAWGRYVYQGTGIYNNQEVGGNDTIHLNGSGGNNTIGGTIVADIIAGGDGDDAISGGGGNDAVDGGAGADKAVFSGARSDYTFTSNGESTPTYTIVDSRSGSPDGTDTATNVETFQFSNGTFTAAQLLSGDTVAPGAPAIAAWTNTTDPILVSGANPLWRISGTAEAGAVVKLFNTTLNADGSVASRTQIATYSQGPNDPQTGQPTVVAGADYVVADANGNWEFQTNLTEHGPRRVSATATDAAGNASDYSLVYVHGGHHAEATQHAFTNPTALAGISVLDGFHQDGGAGDILSFTDANVTVTDADFAKVHDFETLRFAGEANVTLGANALAAGIGGQITPELGNGKIITGTGDTTINDGNAHSLNVDASAQLAGTTLTLVGPANFVVTGSAADTTVVVGGGDDAIDGGAGSDKVVFSGARSDYRIVSDGKTAPTYTIVDNRSGSPDGTDTVTNVEWLQFTNVTVRPDPARNDFVADGHSDLLLRNGVGAVVVGEIGDGGELGYSEIAALGSEWTFKAIGDFLGDGGADFLIRNTNGVVVVGDVQNGATTYTEIGGLGNEWEFLGTGNFDGGAHDQFLIENPAGAVVVADVQNGQAQYTQVAALGSEWKVVGAGDYLGDGGADFLIKNTNGVVAVGNVQNGATTYTEIGGLGNEWTFVGTGDYFGLGHDQFLIENTNGAVVVGDVQNGQAQYTDIGGLGPEWKFVGAGDYQGTGTDGFVIRSTSGPSANSLVLGTVANGQASYAQIGAVGSEWSFQS